MKKSLFLVIIFSLLLLCLNLTSVLNDKEIFKSYVNVQPEQVIQLSDININRVFSNSFFFVPKESLENISNQTIYRIDNMKTKDLIYFKVNTVKFKDSLYFFQHIQWLSKRNRKVKTGQYTLNKILINEGI